VIQPFAMFVTIAIENWPHFNVSMLPALDTNNLMPVLLGMLGLGGMRTFEKIKGAAPNGAQ
jgi:hypothetical protein